MPKKQPRAERKFLPSKVGRLYWEPGDPHVLDPLFAEMDDLKDTTHQRLHSLAQELQQMQILIQQWLDDLSTEQQYSLREQLAQETIIERFSERKHLEHLIAQLMITRRTRLLARVETLSAAFSLAQKLLQNGDQEDSLDQIQNTLPAEHSRLANIHLPLTPILSSTEHPRAALRSFEQQLPRLRRLLSGGEGWFEVSYVQKKRYLSEVALYLRALRKQRKKASHPS